MRDACLARPLLALPRFGRFAATAQTEPPSHTSRIPAAVAEHILLTTDGSHAAVQAVPFASLAIGACDPKRVTVLRVLTTAEAGGTSNQQVHALDWAIARAEAEAALQNVVAELSAGAEGVDAVVAEGRAADEILQFVDTQCVDLLVIASHGVDDARAWRLGSVARKIIADGRVSVLVVPIEPAPNPRVRTIAVALDCSPRAECVLPLATRLAISTDAQLVLAHVVPEPDLPHRLPTSARDRELAEELTARNWARAQAYLDEIGNRLQARGVSCRVQLLSHVNPARGLEAWLEDSPIDLALLSAHGAAAGDDEAHGSVVQRLLGSLRTPLWIVQDLPPTRRAGVRRGMSGRFERV